MKKKNIFVKIKDSTMKDPYQRSHLLLLFGGVVVFLLLPVIYADGDIRLFFKREKPATVAQVFVPKKTNFKNVIPPGFPVTIPLENKAGFSESYIKEYQKKTERNIVFPSQKTVAENYALYEKFFKKDGWTLVSQKQGKNFSFLYCTKGNTKLDVTIANQNSTTTKVSKTAMSKSYVMMSLFKD